MALISFNTWLEEKAAAEGEQGQQATPALGSVPPPTTVPTQGPVQAQSGIPALPFAFKFEDNQHHLLYIRQFDAARRLTTSISGITLDELKQLKLKLDDYLKQHAGS